MICGLALMTLRADHVRNYRWLLTGLAVFILLAILYLVPIPPGFWHSLAGRQEVAASDIETGLQAIWRPSTLTPDNGWNALASFSAPLAVVLLGIQLDRENLYRLVPLVIGCGAASGLFGLLQMIGSVDSSLYFYRITNHGSAVGLFANRNHAAVLLASLFPILAAFASVSAGSADQQKSRQLIAVSIGLVLIPLLLITGSRSGLLVGLIGLAGAAAIYRPPAPGHKIRRGDGRRKFGLVPVAAGVVTVSLGVLTFVLSRATAIDRLFVQTTLEDQRGNFWIESMHLGWQYLPWGAGLGAFAEAYGTSEPPYLLDSTYLNRAHNDWIEVFVTMGAVGSCMILVLALVYFRATFLLWFRADATRRSVRIARASIIVIGMIATASVFDYPLRTPIMMCMLAILTLWLAAAHQEASPIYGKTANLRQPHF